LLLSAMDRYHIVSQFKQRERVVIIDPAGICYLSPLLQFSEAKDLHVQQAELATMAFRERNPKDFAAAARHQYLQEDQEFLASRKNCPLQKSPMGLQFCQDENGRSNH